MMVEGVVMLEVVLVVLVVMNIVICGVKTWRTFAKPVICNSIRSSSNFVRRPCGSKLPNIVISIVVTVAMIPDHCSVINSQPVDHHLDHNIVVNKLPPV